jgi:type IV pilus assembly protein PilQ
MKRRWVIFFLSLNLLFVSSLCKAEDLLISNIFIESDLRQVLRDISAQVNIPIVPDPIVQGVISAEFKDVPLEKCLEMLLFPLGFTFKLVDDYYIVASTDPKSPSFSLVSKTEIIQLNHIKAIDAVYNLPDFLREYVKLNKDKNVLTITAPSHFITRIKEDIKTLDKLPKQVLIEVLVTELSSEARKSLGVKWGGELEILGSGEYISSREDKTYEIKGELATISLVQLRALVEDGKVKIRANPRILTANTEEAVINIGTEKYVLLETRDYTSTYTRLQSVSAGIKLKIVPFIGEDDSITLQIEQEVSDVVPTTFRDIKLSVNRRSSKTTVHLLDNQTIAIGGLIQQNREAREYKIPVLGSIPILGKLFFRSINDINSESELLIYITPKIISLMN